MSAVGPARPGPRKRSLRSRLVGTLIGLAVVPFTLALVGLFFVARHDVSQAEGTALAREAGLLAGQLRLYLDGGSTSATAWESGDLGRLLEAYHRGRGGGGVLVGAAGRVLAGRAELPIPTGQLPGEGWVAYRAQGVPYLAGFSLVGQRDAARGPLTVVVAEPVVEAFAPFFSMAGQVAVLLFVLAGVVVLLALHLGSRFLTPLYHIRRGAEIISRINLGYRLKVETGDELEELACDFNRMAESLEGAYGQLGERVQETTVNLQEERNRLASVLRIMAEGVVVTNEAGEVLLMNPRARMALGSGPSTGIGAPLGRILPADRVEFHLRRLRTAALEGREGAEEVVFPMPDGRLLRGALSPVPAPEGGRAGFLLVFRDPGGAAEQEKARGALREFPELINGPVANLKSLAEVLASRPGMAEEKRLAFVRAIDEEVLRLSERLAAAEEAAREVVSPRWPAVPADPKALLEEAIGLAQGVFARVDAPAGELPPVLVEPFSWVSALTAVLRWSAERSSGWAPLDARLTAEEDTVVTTFRIERGAADPAELEALPVAPEGEPPLQLGEAVRRNRGELWCRRGGEGFEVRLALLRAPAVAGRFVQPGIADDQPEFYDFDLFLPRTQAEGQEMLATDLKDLEYVVFDTETTGLNPTGGDEIVSLGAIRIRRGKILTADTFYSLVNPGRRIPAASTRFHGLTDDDVLDAPTLDQVLPQFRSYVGGSVLVAHNAAFDKKFLDLAARRLRVPILENPILDTLFLSYGIHGEFEGHHLEAIAERLGVTVEGRHTALGDARTTAHIFVRLLPLLASQGIRTLADSKLFCDRMLLLRWQVSRF